MIFPAVYPTVGFLTPYIIYGEDCVVFAKSLELVAHTHHLDCVGDLSLDVAIGINLLIGISGVIF